MSELDANTGKLMKQLSTLAFTARAVAMLALVGWAALFFYFIFGIALFALDATRDYLELEGSAYVIPLVGVGLTLRKIAQVRAGVKREDVTGLRESNYLFWGLLTAGVSGVAPVLFFVLISSGLSQLPSIQQPIISEASILVGIAGVVSGLLMVAGHFSTKPMKPILYPSTGSVLEVVHLRKFFSVRRTFSQALRRSSGGLVHAVDDVSFSMKKGEIFGLAGESGSGKTTILRTALLLTPPTSGSIVFEGIDISRLSKQKLKSTRPKIQVVFQDPYESVNPRMSVFDIVAEGLIVNNLVSSKEEALERVTRALREVQITPAEDYLNRFPHELSGGQRQRVAIARALVLDPEIILADEPVSMLDVSIRAEVINVLLAIREKRGISVLMVTHDLALSKDMVDRLAIMYLGKIVESGPAEGVVAQPYHPYTHALTAAVPVPDPLAPKIRVLAKGEIPTNISPPSGCRFHPRCPFAQEVCTTTEPPLQEVAQGRLVACHFWKEAHEAFLKGMDGPVGTIAAN